MSLANLALVAVLVVLAPPATRLLPRQPVPVIVLELLAGLGAGPHGLGWLNLDTTLDTLSLLGLTFLFFLAGLEVNLHVIRGALLARSFGAYGVGFILALAATATLHAVGVLDSPGLVAVAFSATGLGLVIPILREAGILHTEQGTLVVAPASAAEFSAVILLAVLFSTGGTPIGSVALLGLLAVLAVAVTLAGHRLATYGPVAPLLDALSGGTTQLRVRLSVALAIAFAALAQAGGLEVVLGAFFAGGILNILDGEKMSDPEFRGRLDGIGYGFLVPVFFVVSGARLDLSALAWWPDVALVLPLMIMVLLLARAVPAFFLVRPVGAATLGTGLLCATSLPFIVTAAQLGTATGRIDAGSAAVMTLTGLVAVCAFPALGVSLLRRGSMPAFASHASATKPSTAGIPVAESQLEVRTQAVGTRRGASGS